jgi:hypothetical protein
MKQGADTNQSYYVSAEGGQIYMCGNSASGASALRSGDESKLVGTRHVAPQITTVSAGQAYTDVLASVGASQVLHCDGTAVFRRDSVDTRIVASVQNSTGRIINNLNDVGGYPALAAGTPCQDIDHDGMPDVWESSNGLNPNNAADRNGDTDGDGYTNLEEYLNLVDGVVGTPSLPGDINNDHIVNSLDWSIMSGQWGGGGSADINNDGIVNSLDWSIMSSNWGRTG